MCIHLFTDVCNGRGGQLGAILPPINCWVIFCFQRNRPLLQVYLFFNLIQCMYQQILVVIVTYVDLIYTLNKSQNAPLKIKIFRFVYLGARSSATPLPLHRRWLRWPHGSIPFIIKSFIWLCPSQKDSGHCINKSGEFWSLSLFICNFTFRAPNINLNRNLHKPQNILTFDI